MLCTNGHSMYRFVHLYFIDFYSGYDALSSFYHKLVRLEGETCANTYISVYE